MEFVKNACLKNKSFCYDCGKEIEIEKDNIINGLLLFYNDNGEKIKVFKCKECFDKNKSLNSFRKCEVYSRIVGYIRPVSQWNLGKKEEYRQRKEFIN